MINIKTEVMRKLMIFIGAAASVLALCLACGELDYKNKEFYKQEVYIISAESTSATEREIMSIPAHTFTDTLVVINDSYDTELRVNNTTDTIQVKFKVGIGGSLPAQEDILVKVQFDGETLSDYNLEKNVTCKIPDANEYFTNVNFNTTDESFEVLIAKGTSSSSLIFNVPIVRDQMEEYEDFAFPLVIKEAGSSIISRLYSKFMVGSLVVNTERVVNWSGFPIPKLPEGRYHSARLQGNGAENTPDGTHRVHKFITRMGDGPEFENKYIVWGTGVWSFEVFGLHGAGWMYNKLYLNDEVAGTYTLEPVLQGDPNFPYRTFSYSTVQGVSENNKYDPKTKTLTLYYKNVIGQDYVDVLTFIDDDFTINPGPGGAAPQNWNHVKSRGFNYWLPIEE